MSRQPVDHYAWCRLAEADTELWLLPDWMDSSFVLHTIPWFYSRFQLPSHLDPERPFCATREQWREREKIASANKKRVRTSPNILFPTAKLLLTSSCSIVGDGAVPTEKKRSELNGVIAFVRGRRSPLGALKCLSGQIEDSYLGRNNKEKEKKKCVIKKRKLYLFDRRFTGKAAVRWRVLDLLRRDVWFACTSIQPSPLPVSPIKPSGFFKRAFIKVSKHSSQLTALCCNKTVFTVSVPELMRLNGWRSLSAETKQISCSENL